MKCKRCHSDCKKSGKQTNGNQKYRCKSCGIYQQSHYIYNACTRDIHEQFSRMYHMGCGANKMASFLKPPKVATKLISVNTLQKWVGKAKNLKPPAGIRFGRIFDIDEMQTCVGKRKTTQISKTFQ